MEQLKKTLLSDTKFKDGTNLRVAIGQDEDTKEYITILLLQGDQIVELPFTLEVAGNLIHLGNSIVNNHAVRE